MRLYSGRRKRGWDRVKDLEQVQWSELEDGALGVACSTSSIYPRLYMECCDEFCETLTMVFITS